MHRKLKSFAAILVLGALAAMSHAQVTVLTEDFEEYTNGSPLAPPAWVGVASNVSAMVVSDGSSLVGEFSGYAIENGTANWDHNFNVVGLVVSNVALSGNVSPFLSDYSLDFDLAKISGGTPSSVEVEINVDGGALLRYAVADPVAGSGPQHYSMNLTEYAANEGGFPSMDVLTNAHLTVKYVGPPDGDGPTPTVYQVDNIQLTMDATPFYLGAHSPTGAKIGLDQTISGSVIDVGMEVDTIYLYLDGELLDGGFGYAGDSPTNTFAYEVTGLSEGPHSIKFEAIDTTYTTTRIFVWDFYAAADSPTNPVVFEGFESYPTGVWNTATAPEANPSFYLNGGTPQYAYITDPGGSNQVLEIDFNLQNMWQAGINYNLKTSGLNLSKDINDYSMQFYLEVPSGSSYLSASSFFLSISDANNSLKGNQYNIATIDPSGFSQALSGGGMITIPLNPVALANGASFPMDGSAATWRIQLRIDSNSSSGDQPIQLEVDNMVVNLIKPPFMNETFSPTGVTTNNPTVSATVYDGTEEVATMALYLDGILATNNTYAGGSTTNTISFDWIDAPSGWHTGEVFAVAASLYAETNSWRFLVPEPPQPPSGNPLALYNINFEGSSNENGGGLWAVSNGTVAAAPPLGENNWDNVDYANPWYFGWQSKTITEASGSGSAQITYELLESSPNIGLYIPWSWGNEQQAFTDAATNTIWATALGGNPANLNFELRDLLTSATYDLYLYFVCPTETGDTTTSFSITSGTTAYPEATLTASQAALIGGGSTNMTSYVLDENYVVITQITPDESGKIALSASGNPGGLSAIQLVMRGPDIFIPQPTVNEFQLFDGEAYMAWSTTTGFSYSVLSSTNLMDGIWTPVTNDIPGDGLEKWILTPSSSDQEFFKIQAQ